MNQVLEGRVLAVQRSVAELRDAVAVHADPGEGPIPDDPHAAFHRLRPADHGAYVLCCIPAAPLFDFVMGTLFDRIVMACPSDKHGVATSCYLCL